ncbi:MAG: hypothetical protein EU531_03835 [Promethearchaeota archaeon]|nr:MAG: hypothetical protein EU531_03835 [Candidatus Lokiarchaeota archaeon]
MITTRELINYQFSLIFGYSSPKDLIVGDIIGPGKLTRTKVNKLAEKVIQFLRMYNAILRDHTGSEIFSIEYELYNIVDEHASTKIYPKSMLMIPGKYKDCESLLVTLKPDTGYIDIHKSKKSVDKINELFYEIEEFTERPELNLEEKSDVLKKFVIRFSKKLFGELTEDKWNKKLVGLSKSLPTEEKMLTPHASLLSDVDILWNKKPKEILFKNSKFNKTQTPYQDHIANEHLKFTLSEPSIKFVVDRTLKFGSNLLMLANTGTIDESQERIIKFIIRTLEKKLNKESNLLNGNILIENVDNCLKEIESELNLFLKQSTSFLSSGERGSLTEIQQKYKSSMLTGSNPEQRDIFSIYIDLALFSISNIIQGKEKMIAIELQSAFNYFSELFYSNISLIKKTLPEFLSYRKLYLVAQNLINHVRSSLTTEKKPANVLGNSILDKFESFILNQIEIALEQFSKSQQYDEDRLIGIFKKIILENLDIFFEKIELNIGELVSFVEIQMESKFSKIKPHLEKFEKYSFELKYLLNYILRYSTINRFLKEENEREIADPVTFANKFHRFLERRIGGIDLVWKEYILNWVRDYAKRFFQMKEQKVWSLKDTYSDFINYLEEREKKEQEIESFLFFLDNYIAKIADSEVKNLLLEFYELYHYCISIRTDFPKYMFNKIRTELNLLTIEKESLSPVDYLNINEEVSFLTYIDEKRLKFFSSLIPKPTTVIMQHQLTNEEKDLFISDLYHVLNFKYWHNKVKIDVLDNFKEVYREWLKDV